MKNGRSASNEKISGSIRAGENEPTKSNTAISDMINRLTNAHTHAPAFKSTFVTLIISTMGVMWSNVES